MSLNTPLPRRAAASVPPLRASAPAFCQRSALSAHVAVLRLVDGGEALAGRRGAQLKVVRHLCLKRHGERA